MGSGTAKDNACTSGVCADIGGSFIKFATLDPSSGCGVARRCPTPARDWPLLLATLSECCADVPTNLPLCLSIAGIVDPEAGLAFSANVPCINGRRLAAELADALGRPVLVANDADCMVLAEALRGAGAGHRVVFGIVLGSGVGGGLVIDGSMVRGAGGIAGEWGHGPILGPVRAGDITIPPQPCGCGQVGCLDTLGGAHGLERLHRLLHGHEASSRDICAGWECEDRSELATVEAWLSLVAGPLAMMVNATGTSVVPVAGGLGNNKRLVAALDAAVRQRILRHTAEALVVPSHFGDEAGLTGAALLVWE